MLAHGVSRLARSWFAILAVAVFVAWPQPGQFAGAADATKLPGSLQLVTDDAAFYMGFYRGKELLDAVVKSGAFAQLQQLAFVQEALKSIQDEASAPDSLPGKIKAMFADKDTRQVLDMLGDMFSQEMFIFGDAGTVELLKLIQQINWAQQTGNFKALVSGNVGPEAEIQQLREMLKLVADNANKLPRANVVMGFKLRDPAAARAQLRKLEKLTRELFEQEPKLKDRLKWTKVAGHEYLVLTLDGQLIPWDELPVAAFRELEARPGDVDKIIAALKETTVVAAVGVRGDYLLVSGGPSLELLERLERGKPLTDRPELKPMLKHADKKLIMVSYASQSLMAATEDSRADLDELAKTAKQVLAEVELEQKLKDRIAADIDALAADLKQFFPTPGAMLQMAYVTDGGLENYTYSWGEYPQLDGSRRLELLQHLGGSPLLALVGRGRNDIADYDVLVKWVKTAYGYFEDFALPAMAPNDRKQAKKLIDALKPLFARADKATRELLFPALADGQMAFLLDAKRTSKQLHIAMPEAAKPLPVPEPALVVGVSDAEKLQQAFQQYRAILNDLFDALRNIEGADVPQWLKIPAPETVASTSGKIFAYRFPKDWGFEEAIAPNFGLTQKVGVFSTSVQHTERLLRPTPSKDAKLLEAVNRRLAGAWLVDWAGLIEAVAPWIDYAIEQAAPQEGDRLQLLFITSQVHSLLEIMKVVRTISNTSFFEDGALVSHTRIEIRDIGR